MEQYEKKEIKLVKAQCTQCGGNLQVDKDFEMAICPYCGTPFVVANGITKYNITNNITNNYIRNDIQVGKKGVFQSYADYFSRSNEINKEYELQKAALKTPEERMEDSRLGMIGLCVLVLVPLILFFLSKFF